MYSHKFLFQVIMLYHFFLFSTWKTKKNVCIWHSCRQIYVWNVITSSSISTFVHYTYVAIYFIYWDWNVHLVLFSISVCMYICSRLAHVFDVFNSEAKWGLSCLTWFPYIYHTGFVCVHQEMCNCVNLGSHWVTRPFWYRPGISLGGIFWQRKYHQGFPGLSILLNLLFFIC